ncbi:hypothetical protein [Chitinibacter tainanensis]|uniref:hypothetical protein n=1 Tax=Chitinibacter tainanensis TaxID=230667 RepID=UPI0003F767C5|nr:hypothetical protein [Chitinibacter tainanensis]
MSKFNAKEFLNNILSAAETNRVQSAAIAAQRAELENQDVENKAEADSTLKRAEQKLIARAHRCELLAKFSEQELRKLVALGIDLEQVATIGVYEIDKAERIFRALLDNTQIVAVSDSKKSLTDANTSIVFEWMKAKSMQSIQSVTIKRELQHATFRQANGIRSVLTKCGIATIKEKENAENWTIALNVESKATQKLCAAYGIELAAKAE